MSHRLYGPVSTSSVTQDHSLRAKLMFTLRPYLSTTERYTRHVSPFDVSNKFRCLDIEHSQLYWRDHCWISEKSHLTSQSPVDLCLTPTLTLVEPMTVTSVNYRKLRSRVS